MGPQHCPANSAETVYEDAHHVTIPVVVVRMLHLSRGHLKRSIAGIAQKHLRRRWRESRSFQPHLLTESAMKPVEGAQEAANSCCNCENSLLLGFAQCT
jgi:hypothetical protein